MRDEALRKIHEAILGVPLREEPSPTRLLELLGGGQANFPVSLRWVLGEPYHHVVLTHTDDIGRVHFFNAHTPDLVPQSGEEIHDDGPVRIYHGPGDESVGANEFSHWFRGREALGYVPQS